MLLRLEAPSRRTQVNKGHPLLIAAVLLVLSQAMSIAQPQYQVYGLDFSPYLTGQQPGNQITAAQIQARLTLIAPYTKWVRTYSSLNGLDQVCPIAHSLGLKCAAGASIYGNATDSQEIASLIHLAQAGSVDLAIVGTEALFRKNVSSATLAGYLSQVKSAAPLVQVTTADTYTGWLDNPSIFSSVDVVMVNIYPFFEGFPLNQASSWMNGWYQLMSSAAGSKQVIISETGWPVSGGSMGSATPSVANAGSYFLNFVSWARANNVPFFYFEAFDEAWKISEGTQGPSFGLWDASGNLKSEMALVFNGKTIADNWSGSVPGGSGSPTVQLDYVPPYGSGSSKVFGRVWHVRPADYKIACYIRGGSQWYIKPTYSRPLTPILADGTWSCDSELNNAFAAYLIPNGISPPGNLYGDPPLAPPPGAVANASVRRNLYSISGTVVDSSGKGVDGVNMSLSGSSIEATTTSNGGLFSFIDLISGGSYIVTPFLNGATFSPSALTVPNLATTLTTNFTALSRLLSISGQVTDMNGNALSNVQVQLTGGTNFSTSTDTFGNYSFAGLTPNVDFTMATYLAGYSFNPPVRVFPALASDGKGDVSAAVSVPGDFDGSGSPDLLWQNDSGRDVTLWFMGGTLGTTLLNQTWIGATPGWSLRGAADMNRDGVPDLIWQNDTTRDVTVWFMSGAKGTNFLSQTWLGATPGWTLRAVADINRDGVPDLVWQNDSTRDVTVWFMGGPQGTTFVSQSWVAVTPGWTLRTVGDANRDGVFDFFWQNDSTRDVRVWFMSGAQGTTFGYQALVGSTPGWTLKRAADMNRDGIPDLLWQNDLTRDVTVWFMSGSQGIGLMSQTWLGTTPGWTLIAP